MSNHSGGYMLNRVLAIAEDMGILETIGKEKAREFAVKVVKIGYGYDCNSGEILEDIGKNLGMCYCCLQETEDLEDGLCKECRE